MTNDKKIYFFSDVHLGFYDREKDSKREELLLEFLDSIKDSCSDLIIGGDLFDYWFEYNSVIPKYFYRTLTKLKELRDYGIRIEYVMGNHDFGHRDFFEKELGIPVHKDDIQREYFGKKFYISHGDGKTYNDTGYLILKAILRNSFAQYLFNKLHPDWGIALASTSSKKSRNYTKAKNYGEREGMIDFAKKQIDNGYDYVVMGHRHIADKIEYNGGYYINLGEWLRNPSYFEFDGQEMKLVSIEKADGLPK